ncbi:hypothetical protein Z045_05770 [Rhodococcus pyridinivorans KG-16]|uniref:Uncharacterized protein n=1 Tax=Rhodococcus pyridinivorans KG-16 TaxID=1441730 RepID=A0A0V9UNU3_9NOCA|nr:hypothetical protein Z045_05770 [Rhodococcus pyridinivorans KG-16]
MASSLYCVREPVAARIGIVFTVIVPRCVFIQCLTVCVKCAGKALNPIGNWVSNVLLFHQVLASIGFPLKDLTHSDMRITFAEVGVYLTFKFSNRLKL